MTTVEDRQAGTTPAPWCDTVDYGRLTAAEVIAALAGLSAEELRHVEERERAGKNRVTVLRRVRSLQDRQSGAATRVEVAEPASSPVGDATPAGGRREAEAPASHHTADDPFDVWDPPIPPSPHIAVVAPPAAGMSAPAEWVDPPERSTMRRVLMATGVVALLLLVLAVAQAVLR